MIWGYLEISYMKEQVMELKKIKSCFYLSFLGLMW